MEKRITNMCEYVNYFETQFGNLNELFYEIFQGNVWENRIGGLQRGQLWT